MKNIIYKYQEQLSIPYYLLIEGGQGHGNNQLGGTFKFVAGYFNPAQMEGRGLTSLEKWCEHNDLQFVTADTFDELIKELKNFEEWGILAA